jgi:hypothetical protein
MNKEVKLFRIFKSLSEDDFKILDKAIKSPLFSVTQYAKKLYKVLIRKYPDFDSSTIGKKEIFTKVFDSKIYNDLKLRRVFSDLTQFIKKALVHHTLQKDNWKREKILTEIYADMGLPAISKKVREDLYQRMDESFTKNEDYWKKKMILERAEQFLSLKNNNKRTVEIARKTIYAADRYFAYATVRQALLIKNKAYIIKVSYDLPYLDLVKKAYQKGLLKEDRLFRLYLLALQLTETPRDDVFFAYQSLFFNQGDVGYGEDGLILFKVGLNYAARQVNSGNFKFKGLPLEWYKFGIKNEILITNGSMESSDFSNIVYLASRNNEIAWTREFMSKYIKRLAVEIQEEEYLYSEASISFQEKKFYQVIDNISEYPFSKAYILKSKVLIIKSQFEIYLLDTTFSQTLKSSILSFENYLHRDKIRTDENKLPFVNFCKILKKILKLKVKNMDEKAIREWGEKKLNAKNIVVSKSWLFEKIGLTSTLKRSN